MEQFRCLEHELAAWIGTTPECVVGCSSGTAALHLALEALRLPPGSEVLVPDYTMVACARAVVMAGLTPVFVDCGDDLLMDVGLLNSITLTSASAFLAVHVYGRCCYKFYGYENLRVIEDMAELHGIKPHPLTDAACYSFYRNKVVFGEEGGCVAFSDPDQAALARQLRSLGFTDAHDYSHVPRGHNYRLSNAHARLIRDSLAMVDANLFLRRQIEALYDSHCPAAWRMPARSVPWVYDLRIPGMTATQQTALVRKLNQNNIAARHGFKPMSAQEEFRDCRVIGNGNAARIATEIIYLPIVPGQTTAAEVKRAFALIAPI